MEQQEITKKERSMCLGKVKHTSMTAAQYALDQMIRLPYSGKLRIYLCPFCEGFHIGKTNDKYLKQIRDEQPNKSPYMGSGNSINNSGSFRLGINKSIEEE